MCVCVCVCVRVYVCEWMSVCVHVPYVRIYKQIVKASISNLIINISNWEGDKKNTRKPWECKCLL